MQTIVVAYDTGSGTSDERQWDDAESFTVDNHGHLHVYRGGLLVAVYNEDSWTGAWIDGDD